MIEFNLRKLAGQFNKELQKLREDIAEIKTKIKKSEIISYEVTNKP